MKKSSPRQHIGSRKTRSDTRPVVKFTPKKLRIIAGQLRGRRIEYNGDPATRPMKDRTRESVFSLLGGDLSDTLAIDLFAGTGVLAFESLSRGARRAILLEYSRTTVHSILENLRALGIDQDAEVHNVDTLRWMKTVPSNRQLSSDLPWVVFCCPPYRLWHAEPVRLAEGLRTIHAACPSGSAIVCETEQDFSVIDLLPEIQWDQRKYSPAYIAVTHKE